MYTFNILLNKVESNYQILRLNKDGYFIRASLKLWLYISLQTMK